MGVGKLLQGGCCVGLNQLGRVAVIIERFFCCCWKGFIFLIFLWCSWTLNGWMGYYNIFRQYLHTCSLQFSFYFIPCVWLLVYYRIVTWGRVKGRLGSDVVAQISPTGVYQFLSLCMFDLIRVMLRLLLVILGNSFFKLGVRNGVLAFFSTFICGGHFGHVFREIVFCQMFLAVGIRLQRRPDDFNFHIHKSSILCAEIEVQLLKNILTLGNWP